MRRQELIQDLKQKLDALAKDLKKKAEISAGWASGRIFFFFFGPHFTIFCGAGNGSKAFGVITVIFCINLVVVQVFTT